jgi:hypothetical protein
MAGNSDEPLRVVPASTTWRGLAPPRTKCPPQAQTEERGRHGLLRAVRVTPASCSGARGWGPTLSPLLTSTATMGVLFAGGAGPAVRCRTAPPGDGIDFADRCLNTGAMGVRTRGLDIKAGAAKLKADLARASRRRLWSTAGTGA